MPQGDELRMQKTGKPSEQIRSLIPAIAKQRLQRSRMRMRQAGGATMILSAEEEQILLEQLGQDPMTWIVAITTYLDNLQERQQAEGEHAPNRGGCMGHS